MMLQAVAHAAWEAAVAMVAPSRCAACETAVPLRTIFCPACAWTVEPLHVFRDGAAYGYEGAVGQAVRRYKYQDRPDLARPLGHLLLKRAAELADWGPTCVVPVPLHPLRLAERAYNAPTLIARPLARVLRIPLRTQELVRTRATPQQAMLTRAARRTNVKGAFAVRSGSGAALMGARVLLLDDVRTTGSTLEACADALRVAGVEAVLMFALAAAVD